MIIRGSRRAKIARNTIAVGVNRPSVTSAKASTPPTKSTAPVSKAKRINGL